MATTRSSAFTIITGVLLSVPCAAFGQSTAITYQGRLEDAGAPANGLHDLRIRLFDAAAGGVQLGSTLCFDGVNVVDGLFTIRLDFGQQFITTGQRHLDIQVRREIGQPCTDDFGYVPLAPRQQLTATPFSSFALFASSAFTLSAADGSPSNAVITDNEGRVGIGTIGPSTQLHVRGAGASLTLQDSNANANQAGYVSFRNNSGVETAWMGFGTPGDPDLTILNARSGGDIVLNPLGGGRVGIGTASPTDKLTVEGGLRLNFTSSAQDLNIYNSSGARIWMMGNSDEFPSNPSLRMISPTTGDYQATMQRSPQSGGGMIIADEKNFRAPNPADPTTDIYYCCPEGPEAAMYVRGTARLVDGSARITLPEHFRDLAVEAGMTVQVTPLSADSKGLAITSKRLAGIEVRELAGGSGNYEFDWRVEAVRKGYENYQVIRPWMRSDEDESKAWENRTKWIAERRANGMP